MLSNIIDSVEKCDAFFEEIKNEPIVAMDTEFVWSRSYFPHLGIIQIGVSPEKSYLIDTVALNECPLSFKEFLENPNIMKAFHDAYQDVQIVNFYADTVTKNVLDTQLAASFVGFGRATSLSELVEKICSKTLDKSETLTNWMKRPLTEAQYEYALDDVRYLTTCTKELIRLAKERGVWDWIMEDCDKELEVDKPFDLKSSVEKFFMKECKGVPTRNREDLYKLCYAVELMARDKNLPRSFLFNQGALAEVAKCMPCEDIRNLKKTTIKMKTLDRYSKFFVKSIKSEAVEVDERLTKKQPYFKDKNATLTTSLTKEIAAQIDELADKKGIASSRIFNRKEIANLVRNTIESKEIAPLFGWRNIFLGEIWSDFWKNKKEEGII